MPRRDEPRAKHDRVGWSKEQRKRRRELGQNFLRDKRVARRVVAESGVGEGDLVVELGAGGGMLTRQLAGGGSTEVGLRVSLPERPGRRPG
jgi:16S rRNA (adenine1518-N6/adenine1519-N6)-dimethyltransferase